MLRFMAGATLIVATTATLTHSQVAAILRAAQKQSNASINERAPHRARPGDATVERERATRAPVASIIRWRASTAEAFADSKRTGRPVLVYFTQPTCGPCKRLEKLHETPNVRDWFNNGFVPLKLDARQDGAQFNVRATPTHVVLVDGKEVSRFSGAVDAVDYARKLHAIRERVLEKRNVQP